MNRLLFIACACLGLHAEVLDRIAVTIDRQVITELQLDEEIRVTAFLNHQPIARDLNARKAAVQRLIQQLLIAREMELRHFSAPTPEAVDQLAGKVRGSIAPQDDFDASLKQYGLTESILRDHLATELATLQFIDVRFRPDLDISDVDIENYYRSEIAKWKPDYPGAQPPTLSQSKESIRGLLAGKRTDEALETWLEERRKQVSIEYLDKSLQ